MSEDTVKEPISKVTEKVLTPKELAAQREELISFYTEETPLLELRANYEELITRIDEARFNRFQIQVARAQMMGVSESEEPSGKSWQEKAKRELKKEDS